MKMKKWVYYLRWSSWPWWNHNSPLTEAAWGQKWRLKLRALQMEEGGQQPRNVVGPQSWNRPGSNYPLGDARTNQPCPLHFNPEENWFQTSELQNCKRICLCYLKSLNLSNLSQQQQETNNRYLRLVSQVFTIIIMLWRTSFYRSFCLPVQWFH